MLRYMLSNELFKAAQYSEAIEQIDAYLSMKNDEGAILRILARHNRNWERPMKLTGLSTGY